MSVIRPDPETESCPENTTPCFQSTNIQNMVCYPPDEHDSCPITEIVFVDQLAGDQLDLDTYTLKDLYTDDVEKMYLAYSKTV